MPANRYEQGADLSKYAWLSIIAAIVTVLLKVASYFITGSVGLLSDAAESSVNLVAAIVALVALKVSIRPPDKNHNYGHSKAEYFSAGAEGAMIFVASVVILTTAVERLLRPRGLSNLGAGLVIMVLASVINGIAGAILISQGKKHHSTTLVADGHHLLTDVWTSVGVLVGVGLVALTGQQWLDPVVAILVGLNILITGWRLVVGAVRGLMDISLPQEDNAQIRSIIEEYMGDDIEFHGLRTRESGNRSFMEYHLLVPGDWTVQQAHDFEEEIQMKLLERYPRMRVLAHVEPVGDPKSYDDVEFDHRMK